jgi:hypothetical protein
MLDRKDHQEKIKETFLFRVVKYQLPVLRNIMLWECWEGDLDRAKILVGFEKLAVNLDVHSSDLK